jgi:L-ascorbate metabolism protein UlaG (beta-lactamase superfamily)
VRWLGHSTVVLDLDTVRLLTDPLLRPHAGLLRRAASAPAPGAWKSPDAVLLSHLHHDHAELGSLRMVREAPVFTTERNAEWLRRRGVSAEGIDEGWRSLGGGVQVRLVRAVHGHRPMPHRPNDAVGHLVRGPSGIVWVAGDTALYDEMAQLPALAGGPVDLAVVPVWGWGPRLSGGHMDPEQAAQAVALVGARVALPVHWGTLHAAMMPHRGRAWMTTPGARFAEALSRVSPATAPLVLAPGSSSIVA